jgi:hypothetical protein
MKHYLDKLTGGLTARISNLTIAAGNGNGKANNGIGSDNDDEYYLSRDGEPPRFAYYRHYRIKNSKDEWRKKTCEAAYDSITQDELDYSLKRKLRMTPEERYDQKRRSELYHSSASCSTGECAPECKFFPRHGKIDDSEIINEHHQLVEYRRQRNEIINIDIDPADYSEFLQVWNNI